MTTRNYWQLNDSERAAMRDVRDYFYQCQQEKKTFDQAVAVVVWPFSREQLQREWDRLVLFKRC